MGCCSSSPAVLDAAARHSLVDVMEIMRAAYGKETRQTGYTDGHTCISDSDKNSASESGASLLYGEILPEGVLKLLDEYHLHAGGSKTLMDLGMGTGKLVMQAFLQYPSLTRVVGVELSKSRYLIAEKALGQLATHQGWDTDCAETGTYLRVRTPPGCGGAPPRTLEVRNGNMWMTSDIALADILIMHTDLTETSITHLRRLVAKLKLGCRFVTYQDLVPYWRRYKPPFEQLGVNLEETDTFLTSWSSAKGYHLYCWEMHTTVEGGFRVDDDFETKEAVT